MANVQPLIVMEEGAMLVKCLSKPEMSTLRISLEEEDLERMRVGGWGGGGGKSSWRDMLFKGEMWGGRTRTKTFRVCGRKEVGLGYDESVNDWFSK
eukprot:752770-Hanusia_phi.AAC.2